MQSKDRLLAERAKDLLEEDPRFANYHLRTEVRDGRVVVTGIVDTLAEREELSHALAALPGVMALENDVSISTDGQITDAEVLEEVMEEFAQTRGLDVARVGAKVEGGIVRLVGRTEDPGEIQAAREAAAKGRGVREVISDVRIVEPGAPDTLENIFHSQVRNEKEGPLA
ncbi:MAG: BON domain-containing protein [Thermoanaerobacterales bacterium]|nr:BON domain-containing protein [Thermoanaerobacterales bacterium]